MRRAKLAPRYIKQEPVREVNAIKEKFIDREVYINVKDGGYYLVVFIVDGKVAGERVLPTTQKCIKKRSGKKYCYKYVRVPLPWSSKLNYKKVQLTIKVYKINENGEKLYWQYLSDIWSENYRKFNSGSDEEELVLVGYY